MTSRPGRVGPDPERVLVAIHPHFHQREHMTGTLTLLPQRLAAARPEMDKARLQRQRQRLGIHVGKHQRMVILRVGHDHTDEAIGIVARCQAGCGFNGFAHLFLIAHASRRFND